MNESQQSYCIIAVGFIVVDVVAAFVSTLLFKDGNTNSLGFLIFAGISIVFILVGLIVHYRMSTLFTVDFHTGQLQDDFNEPVLSKIGTIPLHGLAVDVAAILVYLGSITLIGPMLGIQKGQRLGLFLFQMSFGSVFSAFTYILSDNRISIFLREQSITRYPTKLRQTRQARKSLIIPSFICIMTTFLGVGSVLLILYSINQNNTNIVQRIVSITGISTVFFVIVTVILMFNLSKTSRSIFDDIIRQADNLVSTEKNLKQRIHISSVDEIASIAELINLFCSNLSGSMRSIKLVQQAFRNIGAELQRSAQTSSTVVSKIASSVSGAKNQSEKQSSRIAESNNAVAKIAQIIDDMEKLVKDQVQSVTSSSTAIEEMVKSIASAGTSTAAMAEQFSELISLAERGKQAQLESTDKIAVIAERSASLLEANKVIATIASQTNLLAMNAAIEAAHAGSLGAGFAVVADEIRKLAETSAGQSKNIRQEINLVQQAITEVVNVSKDSEEAFSLVSDRIGKTDTMVQEVKKSMDEQRLGSSQILQTFKMIIAVTDKVYRSYEEMSSSSKNLLGAMTESQKASEETQIHINQITAGFEDIENASKNVSQSAEAIIKNISTMESVVGHFKI